VITGDRAAIEGCRFLRAVGLSGSPENERDRDADLLAIAAAAGGDTVWVQDRAPGYVRGQVYRCTKRQSEPSSAPAASSGEPEPGARP
jgi:hypothetical protein